MSVDWHDFVVVQTLEFNDNDQKIELPPPISLITLENLSLTQKSIDVDKKAKTEKNTENEGNDEMDVKFFINIVLFILPCFDSR